MLTFLSPTLWTKRVENRVVTEVDLHTPSRRSCSEGWMAGLTRRVGVRPGAKGPMVVQAVGRVSTVDPTPDPSSRCRREGWTEKWMWYHQTPRRPETMGVPIGVTEDGVPTPATSRLTLYTRATVSVGVGPTSGRHTSGPFSFRPLIAAVD